ncbi:MAG: Helix-turn-helix domain [Pseudomonadota bacterium]
MAPNPKRDAHSGFAERLRALRKARGYRTAKSFAEVLQIDQNTYTRYERGEVEPNLVVLGRIWDLLDLPDNGLIGTPSSLRPQMDSLLLDGSDDLGRPSAQVIPFVTANGIGSGQFAQGFAETETPAPQGGAAPGASSMGATRSRQGKIDAKAWRLAQLVAACGVGLQPEDRKNQMVVVRETAAHYRALMNSPFDAIARFSADAALDSIEARQREQIAQQLAEFAALIARETLDT